MTTTEHNFNNSSSISLDSGSSEKPSKHQASVKTYRKRRVIDESALTAIDLKRLDARRRHNRESAARARQRTKQTFDEMEQMIQALKDEALLLRNENTSLKVQSMNLAKENSELRCQVAIMNHHQSNSSSSSSSSSIHNQDLVIVPAAALKNIIQQQQHHQRQLVPLGPTTTGENIIMKNSAVLIDDHHGIPASSFQQPETTTTTTGNNLYGLVMDETTTNPSLLYRNSNNLDALTQFLRAHP